MKMKHNIAKVVDYLFVFPLCAKNIVGSYVISGVNFEKGNIKFRLFSENNDLGKYVLEQQKNTKRLHLIRNMLTVLVTIQAFQQRNVLLGRSFPSGK